MADHSKIEWTEATWNPVTGCTKVSPGCDHCYAETFAERWRGTPGHPYEHGFDHNLPPETTRAILERMVWGGAPSAADALLREQQRRAMAEIVGRRPTQVMHTNLPADLRGTSG